MAIVGHFDSKELAADLIDQAVVNDKLNADLAAIKKDYVTSKNIQETLRGTPPKYHQASAKIDWNELEFGNHMMRSIGDGSTHAPPTNGEPVFFYTEVILTHIDGKYQNKLQRAWEYRGGKLHVRSFVSGTWYPWTTTTADVLNTPEEPEPLTE